MSKEVGDGGRFDIFLDSAFAHHLWTALSSTFVNCCQVLSSVVESNIESA